MHRHLRRFFSVPERHQHSFAGCITLATQLGGRAGGSSTWQWDRNRLHLRVSSEQVRLIWSHLVKRYLPPFPLSVMWYYMREHGREIIHLAYFANTLVLSVTAVNMWAIPLVAPLSTPTPLLPRGFIVETQNTCTLLRALFPFPQTRTIREIAVQRH